MLEKGISDIYTKAKIHFYKEMFGRIRTREASLSTVEMFCVEVIDALDEPTIAEFSNFINVSSPNAAYKVNSLIKKGYVEKVQSTEDKREYHLRLTDKYRDYYQLHQKYIDLVASRARERFTKEEVSELERMLDIISDELMADIGLPIKEKSH